MSLPRLLAVAPLLALVGSPLLAQEYYKLHPNLAPGRNVFLFDVAPDDERAVWVADQDVDDAYELFSNRLDGSVSIPTKLNGPLVSGGDVLPTPGVFALSPDGAWVAYVADQEVDGLPELWGVPIDGSQAAVKLSGVLPADRGVALAPRFTPDSTRVVFTTERLLLSPEPQVFVVAVGGGPVVPLQPPGTYSFLEPVAITPDGVHLILRGAVTGSAPQDVFTVPLDGSAPPLRLNDPLLPNVTDIRLTDDGQRVVFQAYDGLYSAPVDGSAPQVALTAGLSGGVAIPEWALRGDRVFFRYVYPAGPFSPSPRLYVAPVDGGSLATSLLPHTVGNAWIPTVDGSHVLYLLSQRLVSGATDGSQAFTYLTDVTLDGQVQAFPWRLSPDGERVVVVSSMFSPSRLILLSIRLDGAEPPGVLGPPVPAHTINYDPLFVPPASQRLLFLADLEVDSGARELFAVPLEGGSVRKLHPDLYSGPAGGNNGVVLPPVVTSDGRFAVTAWRYKSFYSTELYVTLLRPRSKGATRLPLPAGPN